MDATIVAILAVLVVFAGMYVMVPDEISVMGSSTQLADAPNEGNGMIGRVIGSMAELTWYPYHFLIIIIIVIGALTGLAVYWRSIQD
jgi:hypothetical protein